MTPPSSTPWIRRTMLLAFSGSLLVAGTALILIFVPSRLAIALMKWTAMLSEPSSGYLKQVAFVVTMMALCLGWGAIVAFIHGRLSRVGGERPQG